VAKDLAEKHNYRQCNQDNQLMLKVLIYYGVINLRRANEKFTVYPTTPDGVLPNFPLR
jgi:hypothetical protein